jgi:hypothetical protein
MNGLFHQLKLPAKLINFKDHIKFRRFRVAGAIALIMVKSNNFQWQNNKKCYIVTCK